MRQSNCTLPPVPAPVSCVDARVPPCARGTGVGAPGRWRQTHLPGGATRTFTERSKIRSPDPSFGTTELCRGPAPAGPATADPRALSRSLCDGPDVRDDDRAVFCRAVRAVGWCAWMLGTLHIQDAFPGGPKAHLPRSEEGVLYIPLGLARRQIQRRPATALPLLWGVGEGVGKGASLLPPPAGGQPGLGKGATVFPPARSQVVLEPVQAVFLVWVVLHLEEIR